MPWRQTRGRGTREGFGLRRARSLRYQQAHSASLKRALADIYAAGGGRAFFRGLPARTASLAGTFTLVPLVMDYLSTLKKP